MTAYLKNYQKKKRILAKREKDLVHAIRHQYPPAKLAKAAENLREARIHVFKSEFSRKNPMLPPGHFEPTDRALEWQEYSVAQIVARYSPHA